MPKTEFTVTVNKAKCMDDLFEIFEILVSLQELMPDHLMYKAQLEIDKIIEILKSFVKCE